MTACPKCRQPGLPVLFGLPVPAGQAAGEAGDLVLMGCIEPENPPQFQCPLGHQWRNDDNEVAWQEALLGALQRHGYQDIRDE